MKNYNGNTGKTKYLGIITGQEFEEQYNQMAESNDKRPIASTILPIQDLPNSFFVWIFYETTEPSNINPIDTNQKLKTEL